MPDTSVKLSNERMHYTVSVLPYNRTPRITCSNVLLKQVQPVKISVLSPEEYIET